MGLFGNDVMGRKFEKMKILKKNFVKKKDENKRTTLNKSCLILYVSCVTLQNSCKGFNNGCQVQTIVVKFEKELSNF